MVSHIYTWRHIHMAEEKKIIKVITPVFRGSFLNVFQPRAMENEDGTKNKEKFGLTAIWEPSKFTDKDKERWKAMAEVINLACIAKFKKPYADFRELSNFKKAVRKGEEKMGMEGFGPGTLFASLTTQVMPGIVDVDGKTVISVANGNSHLVYPGAFFRATVNAYGYDNKGKGVALGLMNLQRIGDGPRLDNRTSAAEDFSEDSDMGWMGGSASADEPF